MGYHTKKITKGKLGDYSKLEEEFQEFNDNQNSNILMICELADYYGALEEHAMYSFNIRINENYYTRTTNYVPNNLNTAINIFAERHRAIEKCFDINIFKEDINKILIAIDDILRFFNLNIRDAVLMSNLTKSAFKDETRK